MGNSGKQFGGRTFDTGAYRDTEDGKLDFEGFLAPSVLQAYAEYMHRHRRQSNGEMRESDNWQKGIPIPVYMQSMWRHFFDVWSGYRRRVDRTALVEALCALLFNVMGMLFEILRDADWPDEPTPNVQQKVQRFSFRGMLDSFSRISRSKGFLSRSWNFISRGFRSLG